MSVRVNVRSGGIVRSGNCPRAFSIIGSKNGTHFISELILEKRYQKYREEAVAQEKSDQYLDGF